MPKPDLSNLPACIDDARLAGIDTDPGPSTPLEFPALRGRLEAVRKKLPPLYRESVVEPFMAKLDELGEQEFVRILVRDPTREREAGLMLDIAQAILQRGEGWSKQSTEAFQEVVSDLYDGFLSAEDRRGVKPPDLGIIPPLVKWGNPDFGPYTWPVDATEAFDAEAGIVSLPPANSRAGLVAWSALGHETAGHDILAADTGLKGQLAKAVQNGLKAADLAAPWPSYWSTRIDETASDVMGILNMGPAAGIGLVAYFRGLNAAATGKAVLRTAGPSNDPHPADILRGWLAAAVTRRLEFSGAKGWADAIDSETDKDLGAAPTIRIGSTAVPAAKAKESARIVAEIIAGGAIDALENHSLDEIQNWRDEDEAIVEKLIVLLTSAKPIPGEIEQGTYAAHAVAAAVTRALAKGADLRVLFTRMAAVLSAMHEKNPSWGPLFVGHPGSLKRHRAWVQGA